MSSGAVANIFAVGTAGLILVVSRSKSVPPSAELVVVGIADLALNDDGRERNGSWTVVIKR